MPTALGRGRWLTSWQRKALGVLVGVLLVIIVPMIWPVFPAVGPFYLIYWLHDHVIVPLDGRYIRRYDPWPKVILGSLAVLAIAGWLMRHALDGVHGRVVAQMALTPFGRKLLADWTRRKGRLLHLHLALAVAAEADFAEWAQGRTLTALNRFRSMAMAEAEILQPLLARDLLPAKIAACRHVAQLSIAEFLQGVAQTQGQAAPPPQIAGDLGILLRDALHAPLDRAPGIEEYRKVWGLGLPAPRNYDDAAMGVLNSAHKEALIWVALAQGIRLSDLTLVEALQEWAARLRFEADLSAPGTSIRSGYPLADPLWWELSNSSRDVDPSRFGAIPTAEVSQALRKALLDGAAA